MNANKKQWNNKTTSFDKLNIKILVFKIKNCQSEYD